MKAMVLAAGFGARLRPLTDTRPKALVEVRGRPLLAWVLARLKQHGFTDVIINAYYLSEQIEAFVDRRRAGHPGVSLTVSREPELLGTGGGIWYARRFLDDDQPFLVHNVDMLTDLDLHALMDAHRHTDALVTMAVQHRKTDRYLLFDDRGDLCGWKSIEPPETRMARPADHPEALSYRGVQVLSPAVFDRYTASPPFSLIDTYLDLAAGGATIRAFRANEARCMDVGRKAHLTQAVEVMGAAYFDALEGIECGMRNAE